MKKKEIEHITPTSTKDWRYWLVAHHNTQQAVWLILYKKKSQMPSITWSQAVDEALCFGWIDSTARPIDDMKYKQYFSKRKPNSTWSKVNKDKIKLLKKQGLMMPAGIASIALAKANGSWTILDEVEKGTIPQDLGTAFQAHKGSKDYFLSLSKSMRKQLLAWIVFARRPETRAKRITEIAACASEGKKPKGFG